MKPRQSAVFVVVFCVLFGSVPEALAFCRATTCDPSSAASGCQSDADGCLASGFPLVWASSCVGVSVQKDAAPLHQIDFEAAHASVKRAFAAWTSAACPGGMPSITVDVEDEPVSCDTSEYNAERGNANIVLFREDVWPYVGGQDALGITFLNFDPKSGEIWDADIEVNAVDEPLSAGDPAPTEVDLDSLLTHEAGHLLGLAHTKIQTATMFPGYTSGSTGLRSLDADDVAGLCEIYPSTRQASTSSCQPRHGYSALCGADQATASMDPDVVPAAKGCSVVSIAPPSSGFLAAICGISVVFGALRRARRRRA